MLELERLIGLNKAGTDSLCATLLRTITKDKNDIEVLITSQRTELIGEFERFKSTLQADGESLLSRLSAQSKSINDLDSECSGILEQISGH